MIVMINGSFGVGKTTVAKLLAEKLPGSTLYDPEWAGLVLNHLPSWLALKGSGSDDFQDIVLWRRSVIAGVRLFKLFASNSVIVPMTFSNRSYFDEVVDGLRSIDPGLRVFCLRASLATVRKRLLQRDDNEQVSAWIVRRIVECSDAHSDPHFGEPVDTEERSAKDVAAEIAHKLVS